MFEDNNISSIRPPKSVAYRLIGTSLLIGFLIYMVIIPCVQLIVDQYQPKKQIVALEDIKFYEVMLIRSVELVTGLLFFSIGASVGSYLNVLVYRMPLGLSVISKPSFCPKCSSKIESRDNVPILGWLWLKGLCRNCQHPISARYPAVEITTGLIFLILFFVELISGGINLPVRIIESYKGVIWILLYPKWDLITLYTIHVLMFCCLLTWSLIASDQQKVPAYSLFYSLLILLLPQIFWPDLYLVRLDYQFHHLKSLIHPQLAVCISIVAGFLAGFFIYLLNLLLPKLNDEADRIKNDRSFLFSLLLTGSILGWKAVFLMGVITLLVKIMLNIFKNSLYESANSYILLTVTLCHQILWRFIDTLIPPTATHF